MTLSELQDLIQNVSRADMMAVLGIGQQTRAGREIDTLLEQAYQRSTQLLDGDRAARIAPIEAEIETRRGQHRQIIATIQGIAEEVKRGDISRARQAATLLTQIT